MNASLLFITWNRAETLCRVLREIPWDHPRILECLVVDNGSTDGTTERVRAEFPQARVIRLHRNHGVTAARNVAAANAAGDVLAFLDDDGRFHFGSLADVLDQMNATRDVAVVTGVVHHFAVEDIFSLCMDEYVPDEAHIEPSASFKGGCSFVRRSTFEQLGGFPDGYFYGCEELDLSYRVHRIGQRVVRCDQAILLHAKVVNAGRNRVHFRFLYRNRLFTAWRNLPWWNALTRTVTVLLSGLAASVAAGRFGSFAAGMLDAFAQAPRVWCRERAPMSRATLRDYQQRFGQARGLRQRLSRFVADLRFRRGLDPRGTF